MTKREGKIVGATQKELKVIGTISVETASLQTTNATKKELRATPFSLVCGVGLEYAHTCSRVSFPVKYLPGSSRANNHKH